MNRRETIMAMIGSAIGSTLAGTARADASPEANAGLEAQVREVLAAYQRAWDMSDIDAMFRNAPADIHWVNIVGMHWRGLEEVKRAHQVYHDLMFKGVPFRMEEIESIRPLPGGGAIVVSRWSIGSFKTPAGDRLPPSEDRLTLVLVPAAGGLAIAHGANVVIDPKAAPFDPIRGKPPGSSTQPGK